MFDNKANIGSIVFAALLLLADPLIAATIYKTVDENGVVQFSDVPPENDQAVEVLELRYDPATNDSESRQRLEDMRTTTDRMVADRHQREQHRATLRQLRREKYHRATVTDHPEPDVALPIPIYRPYPGPWRPPRAYQYYRDHKQHRLGQGRSEQFSSIRYRNSQLMRPLVSRRKN